MLRISRFATGAHGGSGQIPGMCCGPVRCPSGWAKVLLTDCPPADAEAPVGESAFRMASVSPPTPTDFRSQRELGRERPAHATECEWRGLSLWKTAAQCEGLRKYKPFKQSVPVQVTLTPNSGAIARRQDGHITLWPCAAYDLVAASEAATPP
jgi:hypothetical protein